jgi:hypothetical protein
MSQGIKIDLGGGKAYDSSSIPATFYETFDIVGGSSGIKAYPELKDFKISCCLYMTSNISDGTVSNFVITYPSGIPTITWSLFRTGRAGSTQTFYVFVR